MNHFFNCFRNIYFLLNHSSNRTAAIFNCFKHSDFKLIIHPLISGSSQHFDLHQTIELSWIYLPNHLLLMMCLAWGCLSFPFDSFLKAFIWLVLPFFPSVDTKCYLDISSTKFAQSSWSAWIIVIYDFKICSKDLIALPEFLNWFNSKL